MSNKEEIEVNPTFEQWISKYFDGPINTDIYFRKDGKNLDRLFTKRMLVHRYNKAYKESISRKSSATVSSLRKSINLLRLRKQEILTLSKSTTNQDELIALALENINIDFELSNMDWAQ